jgi:tetratricopeptide (TPR) repeat protein
MDGVEVFLDGKSVGIVDRNKPLRLPGLTPGVHTIRGVRMGYEPDGPREEMVYPGQESTISIKILVVRRRNPDAARLFDEGLDYYNRGGENNYRRAVDLFSRALALENAYSQAALYLARTYRSLFDQQKAREYFEKAIQIDPDYTEARSSFGGMLLDIGDVDTAIRHLNTAIQRNPTDEAYYLLAQAFRMKEAYPQSIEAARKAIELRPENAEAYFWLAESLRMSSSWEDARRGYLEYLRLSDFDSGLAGQLNFWVRGFLIGNGKKTRGAQTDIWRNLRSLAYFGLCDSARRMSQFNTAIVYCQKALSYDSQDPYAHYALGLAYARQAEQTGSIEPLAGALKHFNTMLQINGDIAEAEFARKNVANIRELLAGDN